MTGASVTPLSNEPADTALKQQRMKAWNPILDPVYVILALLVIGAIYLPSGIGLLGIDGRIVEMVKTYDSFEKGRISSELDCSIDKANMNKSCTIEFQVEKDMDAPILLYYQIENFYQNHREYTTSYDPNQLLGSLTQSPLSAQDCEPLNIINGTKINPCGLRANTFFNDKIKLQPGSVDVDGNSLILEEEGIAWQSDIEYMYKQPDGFKKRECTSCDCTCPEDWSCEQPFTHPETGNCYIYHYPDDDTTQYLYETYGDIIYPIDGVMNEHFIVWMRLAAKPKFRKLYGYFDQPIKAGTKISLNVLANWEVQRFKGTKSLILTTTNTYGGKNPRLGRVFICFGGICLGAGLFFVLKHIFKPRVLAQTKYLRYKED